MPRRFLALAVVVSAPAAALGQQLPAPPSEQCTEAPRSTTTAQAWLERAAARVLPPSANGRVLRYRATQDRPMRDASDRTYEPYTPNMWTEIHWFDLATKMEGVQAPDRPLPPGSPPAQIFGLDTSVVMRGPTAYSFPSETYTATRTGMNPWTVLLDWQRHVADARLVERCTYREFPRIVLTRGRERLYLSESDATPVKMERLEPDMFWGQVKAEYIWTSWSSVVGGGIFPAAVFRALDGSIYERLRVNGPIATVPADSAPPLRVPAGSLDASQDPLQARFTSPTVDTVRVADNTFLLVGVRSTEAVTLVRDTVFLLDATLGNERARRDSAWIAALYPGRHPVVVVLSDVAWQHVGGLRFWVAFGATIVANRISESFLRQVIDRRWTLAPDELERVRRTAEFRFRGVRDSLVLGGGEVVVHALRGSLTELGVGTWVRAAQFFWAGDYVQGPQGAVGGAGTLDVVATVRALGLHPQRVGAQHMKLTAWDQLERQYGVANSP